MLVQNFKLIVVSLFLLTLSCIFWMSASNSPSSHPESKIASSIQEPLQRESNNISASFSRNNVRFSSSFSQETRDNTTVLVLVGSTLIDGTGDPAKQNAVIIIRGNEIVAVTNQTDYHDKYYSLINHETSRVDILNLTGKYVIPGLFDMHAHVAGVRKNSYNQDFSENALKLLLDYGVTTIRSPAGPTNQSIALKHNLSEGIIEGPEMFTAGRLLNGLQIAIPFVEKQISTEEQAREEVRHQAAAGVDYVKLYVGLPPNLVQAAIDEAHSQGIEVIGHLYMTSWSDAANMGIDALTNGVPVDPTLSIYETMLKGDDGYGISNPQNQIRWAKVLQLTKTMHDKGVRILSGSDIPNFGLIPGASLHNELELLSEAGIKPLEVIAIATNNGAEALGIDNRVGTIEPGKEADMIILTSNPIENISNTKGIAAVIADGKFATINTEE